MSTDFVELFDYRSRVFEMYGERNAALLSGRDPEVVCRWFRAQRDRLFTTHSQSALDPDTRATFTALSYFPYNPEMVAEATIEKIDHHDRVEVETGTGEHMPLVPAAHLQFTLAQRNFTLTMYWIDVYGGGLFVPFRDKTAPTKTYGGGRYLFDTIKGSDFLWGEGAEGTGVTLDFNYAYNPSCAYDVRWSCPLAPPENHLPVAIEAGEKRYAGSPGPDSRS